MAGYRGHVSALAQEKTAQAEASRRQAPAAPRPVAAQPVEKPREKRSVLPKTASFTPERPVRPIVSTDLPEEGMPAIGQPAPMKPVTNEPRQFSPRRRELRKALLLGEILQPKYRY